MNFFKLGLLVLCFDQTTVGARRVTFDIEQHEMKSNSRYANTLKNQEQEKAIREYIEQIERLRHMVEILKSDVEKLKRERELDYVRMNDRINHLEKALATQKATKINQGNASGKGVANGAATKEKNANKNKDVKSKDVLAKVKKPANITLKDRLSNIKKLIENERYTIAFNKLNDVVLSKEEKKYSNYIVFYKAVCLLYLKKYDEASYNFFEVYNKNKKSELAPLALLRLAECFKKQGQVQKARIILEKAKADYPNHPLVKKTI